MRARALALFWSITPLLIFLSTWEFLVAGSPSRQFLFASPRAVLQVAVIDLSTRALWSDIWYTTIEAALGLLVGTCCGTLGGMFLWATPSLSRILRPYLVIVSAIPIFALAPMLTIWFGTGLLAKVAMASFATFFVSLTQAFDGATLASNRYLTYGRSLGASRGQLIRKLVLPGASAWVLAGIRLNIGLALVGAFIGEFISSEAGLGHYIVKSGSLYDTPRVLLGVAIFSTLALLANLATLSRR